MFLPNATKQDENVRLIPHNRPHPYESIKRAPLYRTVVVAEKLYNVFARTVDEIPESKSIDIYHDTGKIANDGE